jgi:hypothetical protein
MKKAILKTLIYADIFDYPMTLREIHKWLIKLKIAPRKVEKKLKELKAESKIKNFGEYYFLPKREKLTKLRKQRARQSSYFFKKAKAVGFLLKLIPWIKLVGISGGLSLENAGKKDDIDFFIIVQKKRLWISRLLILVILSILDLRRGRNDSKIKAAGKICCNIILEEDKLTQEKKDLYTAHEVLQMKVLWQRDGIYQKFLEDNSWAFEYLPNWISETRLMISDLRLLKKNHQSKIINQKSKMDYLEDLAMKIQLKLMGNPKGLERIKEGAVYFHPEDYRKRVLQEFKRGSQFL